MPTYYIFATQPDKKDCVLENVPAAIDAKQWRIPEGFRMNERYPEDVTFAMSDDHRGIRVPDMIENYLGMCMVSRRTKEILEAYSGAQIEFLPFSIVNHKGRIAATDCFIVNVLDQVDCIDLERSDVDRFHPMPGMLSGLHKLFILEDKISPESKLFRLHRYPAAILLRDDLRALLDKAGITGARYVEMGEEYSVF